MTGQQQLFEPRQTVPPTCPHCGTTAKNACLHSADIQAGIRDPYAPRPKGCLDRYDPKDGEIPF